MKFFLILAALVFVSSFNCLCAYSYDAPPEIFDSSEYTKLIGKHGESKKYKIVVPFTGPDGTSDEVAMKKVDLVGDEYTRGVAHGVMLAEEIAEFIKIKLPVFYAEMVEDLDVSGLPTFLQIKIKKFGLKAPGIMDEALSWVYQNEEEYMPPRLIDEMNGIADGICMKLGGNCDVSAWLEEIRRANMLPELIRMACTAYGAWGKASGGSDTAGLVQTRALDFGGGPFANYTVIAVHHNEGMRSFAMVSWPGFVGAVTGIAQNGVGISEKVWMTNDKKNIQKGSYDGIPDVFVLRDILQNSENRQDAEAYVLSINRTWAIFIGVGDFYSQKFDIIGYKQSDATVYDEETMPTVTGQPPMESLVYVDKHPQPSNDGANGTLPTALGDFYGDISTSNSRTILQYHGTGDVHIAIYDYVANEMLVSIGRINRKGEYKPEGGEDDSAWKAYNRPYLRFSLDKLWYSK